MQLRQHSPKIVAALAFLGLCSCKTAPKDMPPVASGRSYKESFAQTKSYMQRCFPGANLRANLYTDISEGEIILDRLPAATMIIAGGTAFSTSESAQQVVNVRIVSEGRKSKALTKDEFSYKIAQNSFTNNTCP